MWDLPRPGLEPVSPALAGRFSTTVPPGKPRSKLLNFINYGRLGRAYLTLSFDAEENGEPMEFAEYE